MKALRNVFDFDFHNTDFQEYLTTVLQAHGFPVVSLFENGNKQSTFRVNLAEEKPLPSSKPSFTMKISPPERKEEIRANQRTPLQVEGPFSPVIQTSSPSPSSSRISHFTEEVCRWKLPLSDHSDVVGVIATKASASKAFLAAVSRHPFEINVYEVMPETGIPVKLSSMTFGNVLRYGFTGGITLGREPGFFFFFFSFLFLFLVFVLLLIIFSSFSLSFSFSFSFEIGYPSNFVVFDEKTGYLLLVDPEEKTAEFVDLNTAIGGKKSSPFLIPSPSENLQLRMVSSESYGPGDFSGPLFFYSLKKASLYAYDGDELISFSVPGPIQFVKKVGKEEDLELLIYKKDGLDRYRYIQEKKTVDFHCFSLHFCLYFDFILIYSLFCFPTTTARISWKPF